MKTVCVFCGSRAGAEPGYTAAARELGATFAAHDVTLVYGGGRVGLMGVLADACLQAGGRAVGVIPRELLQREAGHMGLTQLHVVGSMHERKALMVDLADGFLALPGGMGTLDELFEAITWAQLGIHTKPIALINVRGYFDPLLTMIERATVAGFVTATTLAALRVSPTATQALRTLGLAPEQDLQAVP